jgi:hypothetical protein
VSVEIELAATTSRFRTGARQEVVLLARALRIDIEHTATGWLRVHHRIRVAGPDDRVAVWVRFLNLARPGIFDMRDKGLAWAYQHKFDHAFNTTWSYLDVMRNAPAARPAATIHKGDK